MLIIDMLTNPPSSPFANEVINFLHSLVFFQHFLCTGAIAGQLKYGIHSSWLSKQSLAFSVAIHRVRESIHPLDVESVFQLP
jgi:hypothetical protein